MNRAPLALLLFWLLIGVSLQSASADPLPPDVTPPVILWEARVIRGGPGSLAVDEVTGRVFAWDSEANLIKIFDENGSLTGSLEPVAPSGLIGEPTVLVLEPESGLLYTCDWEGNLQVIDVNELSVEGTYKVDCPSAPFFFFDVLRNRIVTVTPTGLVQLINLSNLTSPISYSLPTIDVSGAVLDSASNVLYTANQPNGFILAVDLTTGASREVVSGFGASALVFDDRTKLLYATGGAPGLSVIDVTRDTIVRDIEAGGSFLFLDVARNRLYATGFHVFSIDLSTNEPLVHRLLWTRPPATMAYDSVRQRFYVQDDDTLVAIDASGLEHSILPKVGGPTSNGQSRLTVWVGAVLIALGGTLLVTGAVKRR